MSKAKGKSIVVTSCKGGVGKTTTAINLAGVFSLLGKSVLLIDFDLSSGAIATYLNKPYKKSSYNFIEDYTNNRYNNITSYVTKYNDNIDILPVDKDPRNSIRILPSHINLILEKSLYEYDIVIIDSNHVLNEFNITLMDLCDEVLLIISNDLLDIKNVRNMIKIFNDINKENYKILLNESISPIKKYYSIYDIKNVIKANIDYTITTDFYLRTMNNYISDGMIVTLEKKMPRYYPKIWKTYNIIYNDLMEDQNEK